MKPAQLNQLTQKARDLHAECCDLARRTRDKMVELGSFLRDVQASLGFGDFTDWLAAAQIKRSTAYHYMKIAGDFIADQKLLSQGVNMVDLMREPDFALIAAKEGGGYRSEYYQARKLLEAQGHQLYFEWDAAKSFFSALRRSQHALVALGDKKLALLEAEASETARLAKAAREALANTIEANGPLVDLHPIASSQLTTNNSQLTTP